ncbi:MAG: NAD(P)H-binding protein [Candidatus Acidiferrales bacterium]
MNALLFGATGMIGQGVLRECLLSPEVERVRTVGRNPTGIQNPKLREIVHPDLWHYEAIENELAGFDACFFCLGISSAGMKDDEYERITYGITIAAAEILARLNPRMTFVYVSGAGADTTERGRIMWARVKGRTENALLRLPFRAAYMFRPGIIEPLHGIQSRTALYRRLYALLRPVTPLLRRTFPNSILTTEQIGRAMIAAAKNGAPKPILEIRDIRALAL